MLGKKEVEWVDVRGQWVEGHATVREGEGSVPCASRVQFCVDLTIMTMKTKYNWMDTIAEIHLH